jgi:beta-glucosidase
MRSHSKDPPTGSLQPDGPYGDTAISLELRVHDLVSRMTLAEKISQMVYDAPAIERLGIPEYNWWNECLHGVGRAGLATVFPQAIGLTATWNTDLVGQIAGAISDEARAKHHEAIRQGVRQIYTGLTFWSPNINIFRDPRWGRGQETYGEDPYLTSRMGVAFVEGLQGDDPTYLKLVACAKHFAVHSGPESDRHHFDAQVGERDLRETYLPAFEACVKEAGVQSIMGAYNRTNGEPCCASPALLETILRQEWGFQGHVVSDCWAIIDIYAHHEVARTAAEAAALAVRAGCDLNCGSSYPALREAVEMGLIDEATIDESVKRLFTARFQLGMFDPPHMVPYAQIPYSIVNCSEHRALALRAARESLVLLKNDGNLLPLSKEMGAIAVIGPNADDARVLLGNYNGTPAGAATVLEGIRSGVSPSTKVYAAQGCAIAEGVPPLCVIPSTHLRPTEDCADRKGLLGAYYDNVQFEGVPALTRLDPAVDFTWRDSTPLTGRMSDSFAACWTGYLIPPVTGTYTVGVSGLSDYSLYVGGERVAEFQGIHHPIARTQEIDLMAGRPYKLQLTYVNHSSDPQVQLLWHVPGTDYSSEAVTAAEAADVVIMVMGISPALEGEEMPVEIEGFHGGDRTDIALPSPQKELLRRIHALGKPIVLVLMNGSALAVNWANEHVAAILEAWYPGQAGGRAIADALFGDYNPGGRLPITFYQSVGDLPPFDDYSMDGRTYRYFRGEPLFPFGYGLSYTPFEYSRLQIGEGVIRSDETVTIGVDVKNAGARSGDEVVQLYLRDCDSTTPVPVHQLQGFERVHLAPGETKRVIFTLTPRQYSLIDDRGRRVIEPGDFLVAVGGRQPRPDEWEDKGTSVLTARFTVTGEVTELDP